MHIKISTHPIIKKTPKHKNWPWQRKKLKKNSEGHAGP